MRTYDRDTFLAARAEWEAGDFGWQWQSIRRIAADRGFLYPPQGSKHDDRDMEPPSHRAVIWRALQDNPSNLEAIVRRSRSWKEVVDYIYGLESRLRYDADELARNDRWERQDEPQHREAAMTIGDILERIATSRGV